MDEQEKLDGQEFDLEDIMREFGDTPESDEGVDEILKEFGTTPVSDATMAFEPVRDEAVQVDSVSDETIVLPDMDDETVREETEFTGDTIRMGGLAQQVAAAMGGDTVRMEPVSSDTMRLDTKDLPKGEVHIAQPINDEDEKEAFTEGWEPEYEQPMGSYNPPPPIIVHPKSRLRELKRKLVAGPEKRYYELSGQGLGKLQAAIFFSLLVLVASTALMVLYRMDMIGDDRIRFVVFGQFFGLLVSALFGSFQMIEGVAELFKGRFTLNTLLLFSFLLCSAVVTLT